jgi:uncharacterized HAD superfamily protein
MKDNIKTDRVLRVLTERFGDFINQTSAALKKIIDTAYNDKKLDKTKEKLVDVLENPN